MFFLAPGGSRFIRTAVCLTLALSLSISTSGPTNAHEADDAVVATVGTRTITQKELNARIQSDLIELETQRYEVMKDGLDSMVNEILVEQAAQARGMSVADLMKAEVVDKVSQDEIANPIGDAQVQAFYEQIKERVDNRPLEELRPEIEKYLRSQRVAAARAQFIQSLREKETVTVALRPPVVDVKAEGPARGPANAKVTIVEFSDFECPFCKRAKDTVDQVMKDYDGKVRLVFRHYPLPFHNNAKLAAQAAICADKGGKFWAYHDLLFDNQTALAKEDLTRYAAQVELDETTFKTCLDGEEAAAIVAKDTADGEAVGVNGTPAFFINGRPLSGAQPYEAFKEAIDDALARSS